MLYHFRNKSLNSPLYDEALNIMERTVSNKQLGHKLYNTFLNETKNVTLLRNYRPKFKLNCERSGWPIDITINVGMNFT